MVSLFFWRKIMLNKLVKIEFIFPFILTIFLLLFGYVSLVDGKAPSTPKILFSSNRDGNREIYMMNPDGSEQVNISNHPGNDTGAVWSPTGEQILFVSDRQGKRIRDLYLMDSDGTNVRRVFKKKSRQWRTNPTWSPDGKQFAFWSVDHDLLQTGLHLGTFGEEDVETLPYGRWPAWSPDGSEIACTVGHGGGSRLTFLNLRTRKREQPLPDKELLWQGAPCWSASGNKLALSGNIHPLPAILDRQLHNAWNDKFTVFIVNRDGTGLRQLIPDGGPAAGPSTLSPDGTEVLFTQEINGQSQIFKLDINTMTQVQLTHVPGIFRQANIGGDWFDPAYTSLSVSPKGNLLSKTWGQLKDE